MKLNISSLRKASLALIVTMSVTTFGIIVNANAEPTLEPVSTDVLDLQKILVQEYQERTGVSAELAKDVLEDQGKLLETMSSLGIEDGVNADIWVEDVAGNQVINIRTQDEQLITSLKEQTFFVSRVLVHREPVIAKMVPNLTSAEMWEVIKSVSPQVQGFDVRVENGALLLVTMDKLSADDVEELKAKTGFDKIELEITDKPGHDEIKVFGGAVVTVNGGKCTSGFTAKHGAKRGFFSAAHCAGPKNIYQHPTSTSGTGAKATMGVKTHNANADIAFFEVSTSGNTFPASVYKTASTTYVIKGTRVPYVGMSVCHMGVSTGWACGKVNSTTHSAWSGACPNTTCNATFGRALIDSAPSDSGGPWVSLISGSYYAVGIHKGNNGQAVFSKIQQYMPSGTAVLTG